MKLKTIRRIQQEEIGELEVDVTLKPKSRFRCKVITFKIPRKIMISYKSNFKMRWDIFILCLAIYNSLMIPYEQAFKDETLRNPMFIIVDTLIDLAFVVDIGLMFMTSIMTNKGQESFNQEEISDAYTGTLRFYVDCISLLGADIFSGISRFMSLFGLFKLMRVFRMGQMISNSTAEKTTKATLNLFKLTFYLFFYLHLIACYFWITLGFSVGKRYYRDYDLEQYVATDGDILLDVSGTPVPMGEHYLLSGPDPTFGEDSWRRWTADETPDWEAKNEQWEGTLKQWYMPLDWVNYVDQRLYSTEYDLSFRYTTMLYYAILDLGSNEFGPANNIEFAFLIATLICSALLNAIIFGDIASLVSELSSKSSER